MYSASQAWRALNRPKRLLAELNRLYHTRGRQRGQNPRGIDIFAEDWDNLLILDACRYDVFAEQASLPGVLETRESRGSTTEEFVRANFTDRTLSDVVYLDSNGYFARLRDEISAAVHSYRYVENDRFGGRTVHPDDVTTAAREAAAEYPNKRLIVHYMQPHQPFLGPTGREISYKDGFMATMEDTDTSRATVRQAYRENLDIALESVSNLLPDLEGKTVVTADHGEVLGDRLAPLPIRYYGHPNGIYCSQLVKVPWNVIGADSRKRIREGEPDEDQAPDQDEIAEKLENLGYRLS